MTPADGNQRLREFVGWLSGDIPELHHVEVPRLAASLDRYLATVAAEAPGRREATLPSIVYIGLNGQGQIIGAYANEAKAQANTSYITAIEVQFAGRRDEPTSRTADEGRTERHAASGNSAPTGSPITTASTTSGAVGNGEAGANRVVPSGGESAQSNPLGPDVAIALARQANQEHVDRQALVDLVARWEEKALPPSDTLAACWLLYCAAELRALVEPTA